MRIDLNPEGGGVLIEGDADELREFAGDLQAAARGVEQVIAGAILTDEAVETVTIRKVES